MTGGWEWVALAYGSSAFILGGYTWLLVRRTGSVRSKLRELG